MHTSFRQAQQANRRRTRILLAGMFGLLTAMIVVLISIMSIPTDKGGSVDVGALPVYLLFVVPMAMTASGVVTAAAYFSADRAVLTLTKAKIIDYDDAPTLYNVVDEMRIAAGLPLPRIAIIEDDAPNAFATGRTPERGVIAVTTGLLEVMDREQLQGVIGHEMAHIANRDTLVATVAATTAGAIIFLGDIAVRVGASSGRSRSSSKGGGLVSLILIVIGILAPLGALLLRAGVSRTRESLADATAVEFTRNPAGLRRALETLRDTSTVVAARTDSLAHLWIESPLDGKSKSMFDTHPPIGERIDALTALETGRPESPGDAA